jgi:hypothetical protein
MKDEGNLGVDDSPMQNNTPCNTLIHQASLSIAFGTGFVQITNFFISLTVRAAGFY